MLSVITQLLVPLALVSMAVCSPHRLSERAVVVDDPSHLEDSYDYIIIGGGTSGLTVADRLTEDPETTVLVIEYGDVDGQEPGVLVPGVPVPTKYSRNYESVPQPELNGRTSPVYSAAVVGGGTVVNGMFYNRGSEGDYDAWEEIGNPGWGWDDLVPYFEKSENFTPAPEDLASEYPVSDDSSDQGTNGPVGKSFSNFQYPVIDYFFRGWNNVGVESNLQPDAGNPNGAFYAPLSLDAQNQSRSTASSAHFRPFVGRRPNYHLVTNHSVTKILLDEESMLATSVSFISRDGGGCRHSVCADKEVILAAGAVHSPQILQLSGIGPEGLLSGLGIETVLDLPGVGYNFQDQPSMFLSFNYSNYPYPSPDWLDNNQTWAEDQLAVYYENRTGPFTITYRSGSIVCFLPLQDFAEDYEQMIESAAAVDLAPLLPEGADKSVLAGYEAQRDLILDLYASSEATVQETAFGGGNTLPIALLKPLSRGSIVINSTNPLDPPVFDYNTFKHPTDLAVAVEALKINRVLMASGPMQELGATEVFPGAEIQGDQAIADSIRTFASSTWAHPVGSLSMMPLELGGVVDPKLCVYNVGNLRVVDASIMPLIPGTHTMSTVYAVAEKAADLIKSTECGCSRS